MGLLDGSGVNREVHAPFCERPGVKFLRPTCHGLHWCLDVTFGEDASSIRLRNAALNFSFLRRASLNLFRGDASRSTSLPRKRKAAAWNPDYLATVLQLREI